MGKSGAEGKLPDGGVNQAKETSKPPTAQTFCATSGSHICHGTQRSAERSRKRRRIVRRIIIKKSGRKECLKNGNR